MYSVEPNSGGSLFHAIHRLPSGQSVLDCHTPPPPVYLVLSKFSMCSFQINEAVELRANSFSVNGIFLTWEFSGFVSSGFGRG